MCLFFYSRIKSIDSMLEIGIFLNDLNQFDRSAEMVVINELNTKKLKKAFQDVCIYISKNILKRN